MDVPDTATVRILTSLGFTATPLSDAPHEGAPFEYDGWLVTVPPWRVDIHRPVDLIEEVGPAPRLRAPADHLPRRAAGAGRRPTRASRATAACGTPLLGMGFSEAIIFAFIEEVAAAPFLAPSTALGQGPGAGGAR